VCVLGVLVVRSTAHADHHADEQNDLLRQVEYAQSRFTAVPGWFDPKTNTIVPGHRLREGLGECRFAVETYEKKFNLVDTQFRTGDRGKAVQRRHDEIAPICRAMGATMDAYDREKAASEARAADEQKLERERAKVRTEMFVKLGPYYGTLMSVMPGFANIASTSGFRESPESVEQYKKDFAGIQKVCAAYPNITNPIKSPHPQALESHAVEVCKTAALGPDEVIRQHRRNSLFHTLTTDAERYVRELQPILDGHEKAIADLHQLLVFDRTAWATKIGEPYAKQFKLINEAMPANVFAAVEPVAEKLRAKLDGYGANDAFTMPSFRDAQVEALVKRKAASELKGSKVYKAGLDYKTWVAYDERTWVKSDATYDYYRVSKGKNRYKRGWILVRLAGQPYCQAREFIVSRVKNGPISVDSLDGGGRFVKCD